MSSSAVQIPALDPPWPDDAVIMVVTSRAAPGWRSLAHQVAAAAQPGGNAAAPGEGPGGRNGADSVEAAFLYRHADRVAGYLALASRAVTGHRSPAAGDRQAAGAERAVRPCVTAVWVDEQLRRHGVARQLVAAAARYAHVAPAELAWGEPLTGSGYLLARSIAAGGVWIAGGAG